MTAERGVIEMVTPRAVARGQKHFVHLQRVRIHLGHPPVEKAICGSKPKSGWMTTSRMGSRCSRCDEQARRLGLEIPDEW